MPNLTNSDDLILFVTGTAEVHQGKLIILDPVNVPYMDDIHKQRTSKIITTLNDGLYTIYDILDGNKSKGLLIEFESDLVNDEVVR